jgi:hypothetical protein
VTEAERRVGVRWLFALWLLLGVLIGALASTAAGLWWTYSAQLVSNARIGTIEQRMASWNAAALVRADQDLRAAAAADVEARSVRDRLVRLEERISPYVTTANTLIEHERHLSAIDGRGDEINRRLIDAQAQLTKLCAGLDGISSASARKSGCR